MKKITITQFKKKFPLSNIYIRKPNPVRQQKEKETYKKGYELRIPADDYNEMRQIRSHLKYFGFRSGKPFKKGTQYILPLYGYENILNFIRLFKLRLGKKIKFLK